MDNNDCLGITSLALSYMAETLAKSTKTKDVKPILMKYILAASIDWIEEKERVEEPLLTEVKSTIESTLLFAELDKIGSHKRKTHQCQWIANDTRQIGTN